MTKHFARTLICGLLLTGCAETTSPDAAPPDDEAEVAEMAPARSPSTTDVALDASLADLCAVRSSFEVDTTRSDASPWLATLASCVTEGPLKGRSLELIAHTSVHHDSASARRRGESRAESLRAVLIENGVSEDVVRSSAAVSGDERSVEVRIAPRHDH